MPHPPNARYASYFGKLNYVTYAWSVPCEAPWYIFVQTMGPATLTAIITLLTFGWDDVFRGYFRPKQTRARKLRKKPFRIKGIPIYLPEIGEMIGKKIRATRLGRFWKFSTGNMHLWRMDSTLQRGLFWWLVADVAVDFFFNWTSQLYKSEWCKQSNLGRVSHTNTPEQIIGATNQWVDFQVVPEDYRKGPIVFGTHHWQTFEHRAHVGAAGIFRDWNALGGNVQMRIKNWATDEVVAEGPYVEWPPGGEAQPMVFTMVKPNGLWTVQYKASQPGGLCRVTKRVAFGFEHAHELGIPEL